ncbi:MAG: flagellar hook protein FlgE [Alphaproteobacteria bacterium]|jgi:flagellar hook protein FlgE|uniref:flagellar hook protein FlgE n=1 Tax=Rhizobium sp. R86522 TaxID=3093861 RepID=UPI002ADB8D91|nr:flagellar hook protein FlgE [Alphaproteobacteria bacterium]MBU0834443.1 flagellar hook protein FlgE [Alphaproteobacteria bacterium]MBU1763136.1 flagellar hook protein FlgE [Alphaproteobacteria bacterium]MDZ7875763.1 flagellar hook protein FlgE [Rhizobium sp.]
MSLYGTMRTGVSGMNAQSNRLSTVADNIANSSTVGYKKASVQFSSMILPTTNGAYNSGGVETDVRYSISSQGTFSYTTSTTDLAINGDGFFIVKGDDGTPYMTRAGSFVLQDDGTLKNTAGYTLQGYPYDSDVDPTIVVNGFDGLEPVDLSGSGISAVRSLTGTLNVNLPNSAEVGVAADIKKTSLTVFDSQGSSRLIDFTYEKIADNTWEVSAVERDNGTQVLAPQTLVFDADGKLVTPDPAELPLDPYTVDGAEVGDPGTGILISIGDTTQLASDFSVQLGKVDGNAASKVKGYEIDDKGIVSIAYDNGDLVPTFRVALASVQSPDNLNPVAGNMYTQSNDSGVVILGYAGSSGFGTILSGALEDSNVDVAEELTAMIESQRNYTANSKVFQTGSELMEVLVNLKR